MGDSWAVRGRKAWPAVARWGRGCCGPFLGRCHALPSWLPRPSHATCPPLHSRASHGRAAHLLQRAREILGSESSLKGVPSGHRAVNFFQVGLEEFDPEPSRYDALWCQWAVMYLTDGMTGVGGAWGIRRVGGGA